jgi:hypothetical protein
MKVEKYIIPKALLSTMSKEERIFFIQLAHFLNEINILLKCIAFKSQFTASNDAERKADASQHLFFLRLLASKLYEGWYGMLREGKKSTGIPHSVEKALTKRTKVTIQKIMRYFENKKNNLKTIRNKFGFHYDRKINEEGFNQLTDAEKQDLEVFLTEQRGNSLYAFSDVITFAALRKRIRPSEGKDYYDTLGDETFEVCGWFQDFSVNCLADIVASKNIRLKAEEIIDLNPQYYQDIRFPFFALMKEGEQE